MTFYNHSSVIYRKVEPSSPKALQKENEPPRTKLDWLATRTMFSSLVAAIVLAIIHHFFYLHFNHARVDESIGQQWLSRIGTAFAFLVKMFAAIAAGIAYVQRQWLVFQSQPFRLDDVDSMFDVLSDVTGFLDFGIWVRNPVLTFLALIPWLIPLAAVITPGTLSVRQVTFDNHTSAAIPQLDFGYHNYAVDEGTLWWYIRANETVSRTMFASSMFGDILQLPSGYQNISYDRRFFGPGIQCSPADENVIADANACVGGLGTSYLSWVPTGTERPDYEATLDQTSPDSAKLFVLAKNSSFAEDSDPLVNVKPSDLIECRLGNYSYHVQFTFAYPLQTVTVMDSMRINDINGSYICAECGTPWNPGLDYATIRSYLAVMDAFGRTIVGQATTNYHRTTDWARTLYPLMSIDSTSQDTISKSLETIFLNATISILSAPQLVQNSTQASSIPVIISTSVNIYVYEAGNLYLAYGIALGCALLCTLIGLHAMFENQVGYSNKFSTIMRAACRIENCEFIDAGDRGSDPLPDSLAKATVTLAA